MTKNNKYCNMQNELKYFVFMHHGNRSSYVSNNNVSGFIIVIRDGVYDEGKVFLIGIFSILEGWGIHEGKISAVSNY
uniref:Uncharacterized protein n=1 Tax=Virgibacillus oceani TaxID=1479511 RepID=A0A917M9R1_9BACI|nr:hypothetical protein GCM10011398_37700 [Virgibacillus oceani]